MNDIQGYSLTAFFVSFQTFGLEKKGCKTMFVNL